jgi:hypothetical protein
VVIATTPCRAETLARDWRKAAWFYARFGITDEWLPSRSPTLYGLPTLQNTSRRLLCR